MTRKRKVEILSVWSQSNSIRRKNTVSALFIIGSIALLIILNDFDRVSAVIEKELTIFVNEIKFLIAVLRSSEFVKTITDPDNETVTYIVDWGDGTNTGWLGPYSSGTSIIESHIWNKTGAYIIKAKAKDPYGLESDWSDPLPVNMPLHHRTLWMIFVEWLLRHICVLFGIF